MREWAIGRIGERHPPNIFAQRPTPNAQRRTPNPNAHSPIPPFPHSPFPPSPPSPKFPPMQAIRFHYRPIRYLWTRFAAARRPGLALGPLGCVSLDDVDPPTLPGPEWVRVQTTLSGICGSDLSAVTAHDSFTLEPFGAYPFTFGHENVGVVAEVGADAGEWKAGDRVVIN